MQPKKSTENHDVRVAPITLHRASKNIVNALQTQNKQEQIIQNSTGK